MRVLLSADVHGRHEIYAWLIETTSVVKPDALILAGDLLGTPRGYASRLEAQQADAIQVVARLSKVSAPIFYLMGNYDLFELPALPDNLKRVHGRRVTLGDYNLVGYQFTLPFTGGPFEKSDEEIAADLARLEPLMDTQTVLVTHGPARGILDLTWSNAHVGSVALRRFVDRVPFRYHVHGHTHEQYGREDRHFNVASGGAQRAILLDLDSGEHQSIEG